MGTFFKTWRQTIDNIHIKRQKSVPGVGALDENSAAIISKLLEAMANAPPSVVSMSAYQIGIDEKICVVKVTPDSVPIVLVEPRLVSGFGSYMSREVCSDMSSSVVEVSRYKNILVKTLNHSEILNFKCSEQSQVDTLECVYIQHEIDHLNNPKVCGKIEERMVKNVKE